jgi:hypothetical protein
MAIIFRVEGKIEGVYSSENDDNHLPDYAVS